MNKPKDTVQHRKTGHRDHDRAQVNPFERAWYAVQRTLQINPVTTLQVLGINLLLAIGLVLLTGVLVAAFLGALLSTPQLQLLTGQFSQLVPLSIVKAPLSLAFSVALLAIIPPVMLAIAVFMTGLLIKVALESIRGVAISAKDVLQHTLRRLPRLFVLSLYAFSINAALITGLMLMMAFATLLIMQTYFTVGFTVSSLGTVAFVASIIFINLRWFTYTSIVIVDTGHKPTEAISASKWLFKSAPGYTVALLLIGLVVMLLFDIAGGLAIRLSGTAAVGQVISMFGAVLTVGILTAGYFDIAAAGKKMRLSAAPGTVVLSVVLFVFVIVVAGVLAPPSQNPAVPEPIPVRGTGFPFNGKYIEDAV